MNARLVILWTVAIGGSLTMLVPAWRSAHAAGLAATEAEAQLRESRRLAVELTDLAKDLPEWATKTSTQGSGESVAQSLTRILGEAGASTSTLASITPASVTSLGTANLPVSARPERVRHTAVLEPIALTQLGKVLDRWRTQRPEWSVVAIDVAPLKTDSGAKTGRKGSPLRVSLTVENIRPGSPAITP